MTDRALARPAALKNPAAIYATGLLGMGYTDLYIFLIPLYGLSLGMSAGEIGVLASARHVLALLLSIHIGVLMDRFGTRRVFAQQVQALQLLQRHPVLLVSPYIVNVR